MILTITIIAILFLLCLFIKPALIDKYVPIIWRNFGKPYMDYRLKPNSYKTAKLFVSAILVVAGGSQLAKLIFSAQSDKDGHHINIIFGIEYGVFDGITLALVIIIFTFAIIHYYCDYKKYRYALEKRQKTLVVFYSARIAQNSPILNFEKALEAIPKNFIASDGSPKRIGMYDSTGKEDSNFWKKEIKYQEKETVQLFTFMKDTNISHISLFALAPMPLLVKLGTLLNEKFHVDVYQKHRSPDNWNRLDETGQVLIVRRPSDTTKQPVLSFSLSADISNRIEMLYSNNASIWHVTVASPNMDMLRSIDQQIKFRELAREILTEISSVSSYESIKVHMAMPVAFAVEFGRVWMPKAHKSLELYDYRNNKENLTIFIKDK